MRTLKLLSISILIFASIYPASASRVSMLDARKSLIAYAIQFEARGKTSVANADYKDWLKSFSFTPEAKAYANGETCLVLGFKSTFQNGLCRLSTAEGAEPYRSSCSDGGLPCNPVVFGKGEGGSVFCASSSAGSQLSKSCAFQTFQYLNTQSDGGIAGLATMSERTFDLSKISFRPGNEKLKQVAEAIFSGESSLDSAHAFIDQLCQDIATGKKTGNQPQDLKTCLGYRNFLDAAKTPIAKSDVAAPADEGDQGNAPNPTATASPSVTPVATAVPTVAPIVSPSPTLKPSTPTPTPVSDCCTVNAGTGAMPIQTQTSVTSMVNDLGSKISSASPCQNELNPTLASWGIGSFSQPSPGSVKRMNSGGETEIGYYGPYQYNDERAPPREVFNAHNEAQLARALKNAGLKESPRKGIGEVARYNPSKFGNKVSLTLTAFRRTADGNGFPINKQYLAEVLLSQDCKLDAMVLSYEGTDFEKTVRVDSDLCKKIHASPGAVQQVLGRSLNAISVQELVKACGPDGFLMGVLK